MAPRTLLSQKEQIRSTESFNDMLPAGSTLEQQTSLQGDLNALRSQLKRMSGDGNWYSEISGRSLSTLSQDLTAAEGEISTLEGSLQQESATRASADTALQANIDAEAAARTTADAGLQSNIDAEAAARVSGDAAVQASVDAEVQRATSAENALDGRLTTAEGDISTLESDLAAEVSNRTSADAALQVNIDSEASARAAADETLQDNIDAEASIRESADLQIQASLTAEAGARAAADTTLQSNIDAEAAARAAADSAILSRLDQSEAYSANSVWVDPVAGVDEVGRGVLLKPYKTINYAYSQVSSLGNQANTSYNANVEKFLTEKLVIRLAPGTYTENVVLGFKRARVALVGNGARILGTVKMAVAKADFPALSLESLKASFPAPWTGFNAQMCFEISGDAGGGLESDATSNVLTVTGRTSIEFENGGANFNWDTNFGQFYTYVDNAGLLGGMVMVHDNTVATARAPQVVLEVESSKIGNADSGARTYCGYIPFGAATTVPSFGSLTLKAHNSTFASVIGPSMVLGEIDGCRVYDIDRTMGGVVTNGAISGSTSTSYLGIVSTQFRSLSGVQGTSVYKIGQASGIPRYKIDSVSYTTLAYSRSSSGVLSARTLDLGAGVNFDLLDDARSQYVSFSATNYSAAATNTEAHLSGINTALGSKANQSALTQEIADRQAADTTLQNNINSEASARSAEDAAINTALAAETAAREAADTALDGRMTTAEGEIDQLQSDVAGLSNDKVSKSGDTMTGALVIEGGGLLPALGVTGEAWFKNNIGEKVVEIEPETLAINVQVPESMAGGEQGVGYFSTSTMAGQITVSEQDGSYSGAIVAFTDVMPGSISLWQAGVAAMPMSPEQVTTKAYVDSVAQGLVVKAPAKVAGQLQNGQLPQASGNLIIDGVLVGIGERVFFFDPSGPSINAGLWVLEVDGQSVYSFARPADFAAGYEASSSFFFVQQGQQYGDTSWVETSDPAVVGTDALSFTQMFGAGAYLAGSGLELVGNTFSVASDGISTAMIADGAVTNDKLAGSIALSKLAEPVYNESEVDSALALKLDLAGGTMSGAIDMGGFGVTNLVGPSADQDAATKKYVDDAVSGALVRSAKVYADVTAAVPAGNTAYFSANGGNLSVELPEMPADSAAFELNVDVYVNGQLMRPGANYDVVRAVNLSRGLVFAFDLTVADVVCVVVSS